MWWGDVQQQMELNRKEIERKARDAWMWADDRRRAGWFGTLRRALWKRKLNKKDHNY